MADIYVKSGGGTIGTGSYRGNWTANGTYALGDRVCGVAVSDYWVFECTTAGTANTAEPAWVKTAGSTTTDNTAIWTARVPSTWANATFTITKATANDAPGDIIYVSNNHAESGSGPGVLAHFAGTANTPNKVLCVRDTAEPPVQLANTATLTSISSWGQTVTGCAYIYGLTFIPGNAAGAAGLVLGSYNIASSITAQVYESCIFRYLSTTTSSYMSIGTNTTSSAHGKLVEFINCDIKLGVTGYTSAIKIHIPFIWNGGSFEAGSATPTAGLFGIADSASHPTNTVIKNVNFSNLANSLIFCTSGYYRGDLKLINCKLPANWSGGLIGSGSTTLGSGTRVSMYNCDNLTTNYRLWIETYAGSIKSETTLVKSGGATDGTTTLSWKLASTANANEFVAPLITDDMAIWIENIGVSKTITVDILHDSVTALTDAEIWLEIDYLGSSASPLGTPLSDKRSTVLTTPTNQSSSTATWTTTGLSNPNKQKLELTFTPQMKGFVYARVCLAKASYTVYIDPEPIIS